jgi:apolipoprotein N-acyltransferase
MIWMRPVGTDAWLAMCGAEALFFAPLGSALASVQRRRFWPLRAAVWWTAIESVRSVWPFSGMPFGRVAFASVDTWWAAWLPWIGMTGLTFVIALSAALLLWAALNLRRTPVRSLVAAGLVPVFAVVPLLVTWNFDGEGVVRVAAVQGNVPGDGTDVVAHHREITDNHVRLTTEFAAAIDAGEQEAPDFVVWPENATAVDPFTDARANMGIRRSVDALGVPLVLGAMVNSPDEDEVLNQSIVWHPERGGGDRYTKMHPVPYGEYIPFRDTLFPSDYGKLREVGRDMARGTRLTPLQVGDASLAAAICFDVAYDDGISAQIRSGGELITVQTSNAMFINTGQIQQQFAISRLRAIEARRWVVVAALNGVSGIIDPEGNVVATAAPRTEAVISADVELSTVVTPAMWLGEWTARAMVLLAAIQLFGWLLTYRVQARRARRTSPSPAATEATVSS